jgi:hypothetical protein
MSVLRDRFGGRCDDRVRRAPRPGGITPADPSSAIRLKRAGWLPIPRVMPSIRRTVTTALLTGAAALAAATTATTATAADTTPADTGSVVVEWDKVARGARPYARALRRSRSVERVAAAVNDRYALPRDIPIIFSSEIEEGPAYFPDVRIDGRKESFIHFPGSFLELEVAVLRRELRGVRVLRPVRAMIYANEFVIAHELGHALVDQLDIPITGKEEDAVDGFAAYLLANTSGFGPRSALSAAVLFAGFSGDDAPTDAAYADEHSLSQQRVYQFLCWIYGSDRRAFRGIVGKDGLPRARAVRCADEWRQLNRSWTRLMEPYLRNGALPTEPVDGTATPPPSQAVPSPVIDTVWGISYDTATRQLSANSRTTQLRDLDGAVLALLLRNVGTRVTRERFVAAIPALSGNGGLASSISILRRTLQAIGWAGTLYGNGDGAKLVEPS